MDITNKLERMSQWLWVTDSDLQRNLIAKEAYQEIYKLRRLLNLKTIEIDDTKGDIIIEEMPQGCILSQLNREDNFSVIRVSSPDDAVAIIESLQKMLEIQFPTYHNGDEE